MFHISSLLFVFLLLPSPQIHQSALSAISQHLLLLPVSALTYLSGSLSRSESAQLTSGVLSLKARVHQKKSLLTLQIVSQWMCVK